MSFIDMETGNPLGQRPLNLMTRQQGMGWMGDAGPTPGDYDNNQAVLNQLVSMGAITFQDANDIWAGQASLDDMAVNMTMINQALALIGQPGAQIVQPLPTSSSGASAGGGAQVVPYTPLPSATAGSTLPITPVAAPSGPGQVPGGSTLLYTATVVGGIGDLTLSPDSAMSQFSSALALHGMNVTQSANDQSTLNKLFGTGAPIQFQFQITDGVGHAYLSDAKSVCDGVLKQVVGNNVTTSNLSLTSTPKAGVTPLPAPSFTSWLEQNAGLVAGLAVAIVALPGLIKKL